MLLRTSLSLIQPFPYLAGRGFTFRYAQAMLDQTAAAEYRVAGQIPKLIAEGQLSEAQELNSRVLHALSRQSPATQRLVEKVQGINVRVLEKNAAFISTLQKK
jgi:hypothetical protein